jgi:hypothetical protein
MSLETTRWRISESRPIEIRRVSCAGEQVLKARKTTGLLIRLERNVTGERQREKGKRKDLVREAEGKLYSKHRQAGNVAYPGSESIIRCCIQTWTQSTFLRVSLITLALSPVALPL